MGQEQQEAAPLMALAKFLGDRKPLLAQVLPSGSAISPGRMIRVLVAAVSKNPMLMRCSPESLYLGLHQSAQFGLEVSGPMGHAFLVPRWNAKLGKFEAQFQLGYRGLEELVRRSGKVALISTQVVYACDQFTVEFGFNPALRHVPNMLDPTRGSDATVVAVYAVAKYISGEFDSEVMNLAQLERHRDRYAPRNKETGKIVGPWDNDFQPMCRKTVLLRLGRRLPLSVEVADAIDADRDPELRQVQGQVIEPLPAAPQLRHDPAAAGVAAAKAALARQQAQAPAAIKAPQQQQAAQEQEAPRTPTTEAQGPQPPAGKAEDLTPPAGAATFFDSSPPDDPNTEYLDPQEVEVAAQAEAANRRGAKAKGKK